MSQQPRQQLGLRQATTAPTPALVTAQPQPSNREVHQPHDCTMPVISQKAGNHLRDHVDQACLNRRKPGNTENIHESLTAKPTQPCLHGQAGVWQASLTVRPSTHLQPSKQELNSFHQAWQILKGPDSLATLTNSQAAWPAWPSESNHTPTSSFQVSAGLICKRRTQHGLRIAAADAAWPSPLPIK